MTRIIEVGRTKEERRYAFVRPPEIGEARSIRLTLETTGPYYEAYEIVLAAPDEDNAYVIPEIRTDWSGTTSFHLDLDNWTRCGEPQGWDRATGLVLRRLREGYGDSGLRITDFEALPTNMEIRVYDDETVIDYQYMDFLSQLPQWRTEGPVEGKQGSYAGGAWRLLDEAVAVRHPIEGSYPSIYRELDISLSGGYRALEFYGTAPPQLEWRPRFRIDGRETTGDWHSGEGKLAKALFPLPEGSQRLSRITVELRWQGPALKGIPATLVLYTIAKVKRLGPWRDAPRPIPPELADLRPAGGLPPRGEGTFRLTAADLARYREAARGEFGRRTLDFWRSCADRLAERDFAQMAGTILQSRYCGADKYPGCLDGLYTEWSLDRHTNMDSGIVWSLRTLTRAYLVDGNPAYGAALARLVIAVCTIEKWLAVHVGSFPDGAKQDLPFAKEVAPDVAEAYDAVRHLLSPEQREYVVNAIIRKGLYPTHVYVQRYPSVKSMNQGLVFAASLGLGALPLLRERPELEALFDDAERWLYETLDGYVYSDGGCAEGTAYWMYSLEVGSRFLAALAQRNPQRFRERLPEGVRRTMEYAIHLRSNSFLDETGRLARVGVNINDRGSPLFDLKLPACLLAKYADSEAARKWLAGQEPELELLWCWPEREEEGNRPHEGLEGEPLGHRFPVAGHVTARSGYAFGDFLAVQQNGPHRAGGHTQLDRGALLIECFGEQLGLDSGTISYEDPRSARLKDTDMHPHTITINGKGQTAFGPGGEPAARIVRYLHSPLADYNRSDLTICYPALTRYERDVFYFRPHLLLCFDRMEADRPFAAAYHLNSQGETAVEGNRAVSTASFSRLVTNFIAPEIASASSSVWPTNNRAQNHHTDLTFADAGMNDTFREVAAVHEALLLGEEEAEIEAAEASGPLTIRKRDTVIRFARRTASAPGPIAHGALRSDGRYAYVVYDKGVVAGFGVVDGTYVRIGEGDGGFELTSSGAAPFTAFAEARPDGRFVLSPAADGREAELQLRLPPSFAPSAAAPDVSIRLRADRRDAERIVIGSPSDPRPGEHPPVEVCTAVAIVDGEPFPAGTRVPYGRTPRRIEAVLRSQPAPFVRDSLLVLLDGQDVSARAAISWSGEDRTVRVALDALPEDPALDRSRHAHTVSVRATGGGIERRTAHAFVQFYTQIAGSQPSEANPLLQWPIRLVAGRVVAGSILPNPHLMGSCYQSGGYPIKVGGIEYGDAVHCEPGRDGRKPYFEVVCELPEPGSGSSGLFEGAWAVDDGAGVDELPGRATVELEQAGEWRLRYSSPPLKRHGEPAPFSIRLNGARRMRIRCEQGASIVLLQPRLVHEEGIGG